MAAAACPLCKKAGPAGPVSSHLARPSTPLVARCTAAWVRTRRNDLSCTAHASRLSNCSASRVTDDGTAQQPLRTEVEAVTPFWDVVGLGQPMVDFSATVNDDLLVRLGIIKGSRRYVVTAEWD